MADEPDPLLEEAPEKAPEPPRRRSWRELLLAEDELDRHDGVQAVLGAAQEEFLRILPGLPGPERDRLLGSLWLQVEVLLLQDLNHRIVHHLRHLAQVSGTQDGPGVRVGATVDDIAEMVGAKYDDVDNCLKRLEAARPLAWQSPAPGRVEVEVVADGPGVVLITALDDPGWTARLVEPGGRERPEAVRALFPNRRGAGWQGVRIPSPFRGTLHLIYRDRHVATGLAVSGVAWLAWLVAYWGLARPRGRAVDPADRREGEVR